MPLVNRGKFGRISECNHFLVSLHKWLGMKSFSSVREALKERDCKFLCRKDLNEKRDEQVSSSEFTLGNGVNSDTIKNPHRNSYRQFS